MITNQNIAGCTPQNQPNRYHEFIGDFIYILTQPLYTKLLLKVEILHSVYVDQITPSVRSPNYTRQKKSMKTHINAKNYNVNKNKVLHSGTTSRCHLFTATNSCLFQILFLITNLQKRSVPWLRIRPVFIN